MRVGDLPGKPTFGECCDDWVFDFVAAVFGGYDSETGKHYPKEDGVPDEIIDRCDAVPLKYDALKLLTGAYNVKPRPYIIVKVKDAKLYVLTDEAGNEIVYEYNGKEYVASEIDYELGEIIEDKSRV